MTSIQPIDKTPPHSPTLDRAPPTLIRFNSARIAPEKIENVSDNPIESPLGTPFDLQIDDGLVQADKFLFPSSRIAPFANQNDGQRVVKISEYRAPENTPFEPITPKISPKKLHRYILLTPRTIFSLSLLTILSLAIVLIGFGIAISNRRSQLDYQCLSISYCPRNSSYTLLCNITTEYCSCYNTENELIGCIKQRQYGDGCYRSQECSIYIYKEECLFVCLFVCLFAMRLETV
jgi:hypothetical protein